MNIFDEYKLDPLYTDKGKTLDPAKAPSKSAGKASQNDKASRSDEHKHPLEESRHRVEKVFVESSISDSGDEGCGTHYLERIVAVTDEDEHAGRDMSGLAAAIVLGEALGKPRSRNPWLIRRK